MKIYFYIFLVIGTLVAFATSVKHNRLAQRVVELEQQKAINDSCFSSMEKFIRIESKMWDDQFSLDSAQDRSAIRSDSASLSRDLRIIKALRAGI